MRRRKELKDREKGGRHCCIAIQPAQTDNTGSKGVKEWKEVCVCVYNWFCLDVCVVDTINQSIVVITDLYLNW